MPATREEDNGGEIDKLMARLFGRSWKTSFAGGAVIVGSAIQALAHVLPIPGQVLEVVGVLIPIIGGGGLILAKDRNVSGTNKQ